MGLTDQIIPRLRGTLQSIFKIGAIQLKDNSGVAEIRDSSDSAYAPLTTGKVTIPLDVDETGLVVKGHSTQTMNLVELRHNNDTLLGIFNNQAEATLPKLTMIDSSDIPPLNVVARSVEPTNPITRDIYLDDGTNRADGLLGYRQWNSATWDDLVDTSGIGGGGGGISNETRLKYLGDSASVINQIVLIGNEGVRPSVRNRAGRCGIIIEAGVSVGSDVEIALSGLVSVIASETIVSDQKLMRYQDPDITDTSGHVGKVSVFNGSEGYDYIIGVAESSGDLDDTILMYLTPAKHEIDDGRDWVLGQSALGIDTYLATVDEAFPDEKWVLGTSGLGVGTYLTHRQI